ncbi:MAG TPA: hypothetical protein VKG78_07715 [Opitutaceae bacterium]|nr:hypothetical protein [Opitutaceae bacterium]
MGQTTRSQGISFTHDMWARIEARCRDLRFGRSQYFQMLVEWDLRFRPEIHAHKADGKWHLYPEAGGPAPEREELRAAEGPAEDAGAPAAGRRRGRRRPQ